MSPDRSGKGKRGSGRAAGSCGLYVLAIRLDVLWRPFVPESVVRSGATTDWLPRVNGRATIVDHWEVIGRPVVFLKGPR